MENVTLVPAMHRGAERILIIAAKRKVLNDALRKLPGVKWSQTHTSWYVPLSESNYQSIHQALHGLVNITADDLNKYLLKERRKVGRSSKTCCAARQFAGKNEIGACINASPSTTIRCL